MWRPGQGVQKHPSGRSSEAQLKDWRKGVDITEEKLKEACAVHKRFLHLWCGPVACRALST